MKEIFDKIKIQLNLNYWYSFISVVGFLLILFSSKNEYLGFGFLFWGVGVWSTQNTLLNSKREEIGGKEHPFSAIFKLLGVVCLLVWAYQLFSVLQPLLGK